MISAIWGSVSLLSARQKLLAGAYAAGGLAFNLLDLAALGILGLVGGTVIGDAPPLLSNLRWGSTTDLVVTLLGIAGALFLAKTVGGLALASRREKFLASLDVYYSGRLADHLFHSNLAHLQQISHSRLQWLLLRSTQTAFAEIIGKSLSLLSEVALSVSILVVFFFVDWVAALGVLTYFSIIVLIFQFATKRTNAKAGSEFLAGSVAVGTQVDDIVRAFREITVLAKVGVFVSKFVEGRRAVAEASASQKFLQSLPRLILELGLILGAIGFLVFEMARSNGEPNLTLISVFIVGSLKIMSSLLPIQASRLTLQYQAASAKDAQEAIRTLQSLQPTGAPASTHREIPMPAKSRSEGIAISVRDVSFAYGDERSQGAVVEDVSVEIAPSSFTAIIGPSGAGKSTLIDLILGLQSPDSGSVLVAGRTPLELTRSDPGIIGYVPQKPGLVTGSVLENVALGVQQDEADESRAWEVLEIAQLADHVDSLPDGIHSDFGSNSNGLSGGQLQRIGLARALYFRPQLLVLDEATSALDPDTESAISKALSELRKSTTILAVAHRLSTIKAADVVHLMDRGEFVAAGTLRELRANHGVVRRYADLMSLD